MARVVTLVNDGAKALQMFQGSAPYTYRAILKDIRMPEVIERALESGCTEYLTKPVDQEKLYQTLAKWE